MTRADLASRVRQHPFAPFRLVLTEGTAYQIHRPEQVMLGRDSVVIGLPSQNGEEDFFETTVLVYLYHVVNVEPIPAPPASAGNG